MKSIPRQLQKTLEKLALLIAWIPIVIAIFYFTIPLGNTHANHFDTLLVLGYPANPDGTPSPEQRARVLEAVRQFQAGVAPVIVLSGGAAHNRFVEAAVMAKLAEASGVPARDIMQEGRARNTIENIAFSLQIMRAHGWQSAEVVTTPAHVRRASLIVMHSSPAISWRMQAAPWPAEYSLVDKSARYAFEAYVCAKMRILGFKELHVGFQKPPSH